MSHLRKRSPEHKLMLGGILLLFALEGSFFQFLGSINGFGNNLYATNLGATDSQIGMVSMIPNLVAMFLMLPMGILSDRSRSSRTMPLITLLVMAFGYILLGMVPVFDGARITVFFIALAFCVGGTALYNAQWQSFFGDVVSERQRNDVLTNRSRYMMAIGIFAPILCGVLMGRAADSEGKLRVLQIFYFVCAAFSLLQAWVISRIDTPVRDESQRKSFSMRDVGSAVVSMAKDANFRRFFIPVIAFYITWQLDWSMWYIGQVQYVGFSETDMSINSGIFNLGQLVAVGIFSAVVHRKGTDFTLPFAGLSLMTCPVTIMLTTLLPQPLRLPFFSAGIAVLNAPQVAVNLCVVQILLRIAPEKSRGLCVSLFTLSTTITNSFVPYLGVRLYTALGADYRAMISFFSIVVGLRFFSWLMLQGRYLGMKKRGEIVI